MIVSLDKLDKYIKLLEKLQLKYKIIYTTTSEILTKSVDDLIPTDDKTIHMFIYVLTDQHDVEISFSQFEKWKSSLVLKHD